MDLLVGSLLLRPYVFLFLAAFLVAGARDLGFRHTLLFGGIVWPVAWVAEFASGSTRSRAATTSAAVAGRSAGTFASSARISASRSGGQCSEFHDGATGVELMCCEITAVGESPANGGFPVTSSYSIAPSE